MGQYNTERYYFGHFEFLNHDLKIAKKGIGYLKTVTFILHIPILIDKWLRSKYIMTYIKLKHSK